MTQTNNVLSEDYNGIVNNTVPPTFDTQTADTPHEVNTFFV